jgi:hypothetical protein
MRRRAATAAGEEATAIRFAWWAAFFATLALVLALGVAKSAQAMPLPAAVPGPTGAAAWFAAEEFEEFEEDEEAEAGEEFEEECEVDEECEEEADDFAAAPAECLLSRAEPTVTALASRDRVRLQIRYASSSPATVAVEYGLRGGKGSLYLGGEKKRLARHGVLRLTETLSEAQMAKVMAARAFTVRLRVAAAPGYCRPFFDLQLDSRRATPTGLAWR